MWDKTNSSGWYNNSSAPQDSTKGWTGKQECPFPPQAWQNKGHSIFHLHLPSLPFRDGRNPTPQFIITALWRKNLESLISWWHLWKKNPKNLVVSLKKSYPPPPTLVKPAILRGGGADKKMKWPNAKFITQSWCSINIMLVCSGKATYHCQKRSSVWHKTGRSRESLWSTAVQSVYYDESLCVVPPGQGKE